VCLFPGSPHGDKLIKQSRESDGSRPVVAQDPVPVAGTSSPIAQNGAVVQDEVQHRIPPPVVSTDDEHIAPVVELQVPVSPSVVHGAEVLARGIWQNGGTTRDRLVPDRAHPSVIEPMIDLAVSKGWLVVHGENVDQGSVNPTPWSAVPSDSSSAWGPGVRSLSR
jgi:hypothetical protein